MYVYRTDECISKAKDCGLQERVNKLIEELREADSPRPWFEPFNPYWKRRIDNFRLLAKIEQVEDDEVLCFLDILKRGDSEYEKGLCQETKEFGKNKLEPLLDKDNLCQWLEEQKNGNQKPNLRLPLPQEHHLWFDLPQWQTDESEVVIYESDLWLRKLKQKDINRWLSTYHNIILHKIVENNEEGISTNFETLKLCCEGNIYVLFARLTTKREIVFLVAPFDKQPSKTEIEEAINEIDLIKVLSSDKPINPDDLASLAPRSYPSYMLYDPSSWMTLEEEEDSNITLSGEEEDILNSVSTPGNASLPMFINGRAGSGKSTMLFYLFADYCDRQWKVSKQEKRNFYDTPHPLFLTYSETLLQEATGVVKKL